MDDDINLDDLPMGELVTVSERELPPELSDEKLQMLRDPRRNPGNVERERIAELRNSQRTEHE